MQHMVKPESILRKDMPRPLANGLARYIINKLPDSEHFRDEELVRDTC